MMRKHSPRKWLHAVLDLLPLIIIPIFAIYSHRHTIDNYAIEVSQNEIVDFNQLVSDSTQHTLLNNDTYEFNTLNYFNEGIYVVSYKLIGTPQNDNIFLGAYNSNYQFVAVTTSLLTDDTSVNNIHYKRVSINQYDDLLTGNQFYNQTNTTIDVSALTFTNLTQMFGSGNEPTLEQYLQWYPNQTYDYTLSHKELLKNVGTTTYNDTDIGSQFVYALYRPIDKYFNLSQVGVFGQLYDFLQVNMFNGNAPISIFIVYHVILYEFIMDLIFLIYCVFMFIIDFAEKMLDSFFDMSFGGGKR